MRVPRIYTVSPLHSGAQISLEAAASHHLLKVLRMDIGREVCLFDGQGCECPGTLVAIEHKRACVQLGQPVLCDRESPLDLTLAIGVAKGDRFDWVLQKATELGVRRVMPLLSERSELRLSAERWQKKQASWGKILIAACEQCQRNTLPQLYPPQPLEHFLSHCQAERKLVLHHRSEQQLMPSPAPQSAALLIGPEGGLSAAEIALALRWQFQPLRLGTRVLRTETAPVVAASVLQYLWGDLHST